MTSSAVASIFVTRMLTRDLFAVANRSGQIVGEHRSPSLHDDSYLQHKQQKNVR